MNRPNKEDYLTSRMYREALEKYCDELEELLKHNNNDFKTLHELINKMPEKDITNDIFWALATSGFRKGLCVKCGLYFHCFTEDNKIHNFDEGVCANEFKKWFVERLPQKDWR